MGKCETQISEDDVARRFLGTNLGEGQKLNEYFNYIFIYKFLISFLL